MAATPQQKSDSWRRLSLALFHQEKNDEARDAAQKMFAIGVASPKDLQETRTNIISSYLNEQKWAETRQASEAFLADPLMSDESKWLAHFALGLSDNGLKDDEKAREQLALVIADDNAPGFFRELLQLTLGQSYQRSGQLDEAQKHFEAVTQIKDISGDLLIGAYEGWGEVAQKQNQPATAATQFAVARSLLTQKADGQYKAKDFAGAIISYKDALKTGVPEPQAEIVVHQQLGQAYQELKDYDNAIAQYQTVVDTEPDAAQPNDDSALNVLKPLTFLGLAKCYIAQKKSEPARSALNKFMGYADEVPAMLFRKEAEDLLKSLPPKA